MPVPYTQTLGPGGGTLELPRGGALIVPPGALAEATTITADGGEAPAELASLSSDELVFYVVLEPSGLVFDAPVQIVFPSPKNADGTNVPLKDLVAISFDTGSAVASDDDETEGDPQGPLLPIKRVDDTHLAMSVLHFTAAAVMHLPKGVGQPLSKVASAPGFDRNLATAKTLSISQQLLEVALNDTSPLDARLNLVAVPSLSNIRVNMLDEVPADPFMLVSPAVAAALTAAAKEAKTGQFLINSSWRSLATQYVIAASKKPGDLAAAAVGGSAHGVGAAVDLQPEGDGSDDTVADQCAAVKEGCKVGKKYDEDCIARKMFPKTAEALLKEFDFQPFCAVVDDPDAKVPLKANPCCDPVHWQLRNDPNRQLFGNVVRGFQTLWERSNPCEPDEDVPVSASGKATVPLNTLLNLANSPSGGFDADYVTTDYEPPAKGAQGLGCPQGNASDPVIGPKIASLCCPADALHDEASCTDRGFCGCPPGAVAIPGGAFTPADQSGAATVPAFCMDKTEVTVEAYGACVTGKTCSAAGSYGLSGWDQFCNSGNPQDRSKHPINCVAFAQAVAYCAAAGGKLPTEMEWEWAARSGADALTFPWGSDQACGSHGNVCGPECAANFFAKQHGPWPSNCSVNDGFAETAPVGSFADGGNRWGVVDLIGNVREWTDSSVLRGGGWIDSDTGWESSTVGHPFDPTAQDTNIGFRCVYH